MSVVCAKVDKDHITIAADSIVIRDDLKRANFKKLQKIHDVIVGGCGAAEELSLFFEFVKIHHAPKEVSIKGIQDYMLLFSAMKNQYTNEPKIENAYIIVVDNRVFEIDGMFVQEVFNYTAIGEGDVYALSALHLGHTVEEAVQVACELCCFVSEPIVKFTIER